MKKLILILSMTLLASCGGDDSIDQAAGVCSSTKPVASFWTREDGAQFDISNTTSGVTYQLVVTDDGTCDALDGELFFEYYESSKTYYEQTCDGSTTALYDYNISCDNVLTITNRATGAKTTFR